METRLAKRRRLETAAQQALERNIDYWRARGVPPGVVRWLLPIARVLGRLPLPGDMVDAIALRYLWDMRRPIRQLWNYLRPISQTDTDQDVHYPEAHIRTQTGFRYMTLRYRRDDSSIAYRIVSLAQFVADELGGIWSYQWDFMNELVQGDIERSVFADDRQRVPSDPFFPPNRPRRHFGMGMGSDSY